VDDIPMLRLIALAWPGPRTAMRAATAVAAFAATLAIAAQNAHAPLDIHAGAAGQALAATVPLAAALVAAWAVARPWPAFLAILLLTPCWDVAQVSWQVWQVQVILQTVFVVALAAGCVLRKPDAVVDRAATPRGDGTTRVAGIVTIAFLALAAASTAISPDRQTSFTVLLHGILEPVAMAALLVVMCPGRRGLWLVALTLGVSVAIGSAINIAQSVPAFGTLHELQTRRLLFSRLTYFNGGLFGEMLAMAAPLILGVIAARRNFGLGRRTVAVLAAVLAVSAIALFLTFSKSAYIATAAGAFVFLLLASHTWRRRIAITAASVALSALVVPWPAFVLQVAPPLNSAYRSAMVSLVGESRFDSWNPSQLSGHGSLTERLYATEAAIRMAVDHPLLGIGLDQFGTQYATKYQPADSHFTADSAHTFWAEIAAELGIPALVLVMLIFAAALLALWRVYRAPPDEVTRLLAVTLLAAMFAWIVVASSFAGDMYRPWRNMSSDFVMMAVLVAASLAFARGVRGAKPESVPTTAESPR
jgi:O-antigen ligase